MGDGALLDVADRLVDEHARAGGVRHGDLRLGGCRCGSSSGLRLALVLRGRPLRIRLRLRLRRRLIAALQREGDGEAQLLVHLVLGGLCHGRSDTLDRRGQRQTLSRALQLVCLSSAAARPTTARPSASFSTGSRARRGYVGRAKVQLCHAVDGLLRALAALGRTEETGKKGLGWWI